MTGVRFMGPADGPAAPLGPNGYGQAMIETQAADAQALAAALGEMGRNSPRSPAALAEDLAAQALAQYGQTHLMRGLSDAGSAAGGWSARDADGGYRAALADILRQSGATGASAER